MLGAVVGRQDGAVGEEDEQVSSAALDGVLELFAGRMGRGGTHQVVECAVGNCSALVTTSGLMRQIDSMIVKAVASGGRM